MNTHITYNVITVILTFVNSTQIPNYGFYYTEGTIKEVIILLSARNNFYEQHIINKHTICIPSFL